MRVGIAEKVFKVRGQRSRSRQDQMLLASCLIYAQALLEYVNLIVWVCSVNKMLLSVKFAEDKVLTFLILREKCLNSATLESNLNS